jgi:hypothetical protein
MHRVGCENGPFCRTICRFRFALHSRTAPNKHATADDGTETLFRAAVEAGPPAADRAAGIAKDAHAGLNGEAKQRNAE